MRWTMRCAISTVPYLLELLDCQGECPVVDALVEALQAMAGGVSRTSTRPTLNVLFILLLRASV